MNFLQRLISTSVLASAAVAVPATAAPIVFNYTGLIDTWTVAATGTYKVTAVGAQGGHGTTSSYPYVGGRGASMTGSFIFSAGQTFFLAVGGEGTSYAGSNNGGGGGGSFFVDAAGNPLLIAGGGGGIRAYASQNGCDASITAYGVAGSGSSASSPCAVKGYGLGLGGNNTGGSWGAAGAGFYGDGADDFGVNTGGFDWAHGLLGGFDSNVYGSYCSSVGGFGGGGSGTGCGGGGGGGGYSGGDGGFIAGGGGSWNSGFDPLALAGVGYGNGRITIEYLSGTVPEPDSVSLMALALLALGISFRRRSMEK